MCKNIRTLLAVMVLSVGLTSVGFACDNVVPTPQAPNASWMAPATVPFETYYKNGHFYHDCGNGKCYIVEPKTVGEVFTYHYYYGRS